MGGTGVIWCPVWGLGVPRAEAAQPHESLSLPADPALQTARTQSCGPEPPLSRNGGGAWGGVTTLGHGGPGCWLFSLYPPKYYCAASRKEHAFCFLCPCRTSCWKYFPVLLCDLQQYFSHLYQTMGSKLSTALSSVFPLTNPPVGSTDSPSPCLQSRVAPKELSSGTYSYSGACLLGFCPVTSPQRPCLTLPAVLSGFSSLPTAGDPVPLCSISPKATRV